MEVGLAVLADGANVSREGKLNILGIFDRVLVRELPGRLPPMQLVLRLEARREDLDAEHSVRVRLLGPEGEPIVDLNGAFTPRSRDGAGDVAVNHIISFAAVPLRQVGRHRVLVVVDDAPKREIPLLVVHAPPPPEPPRGADSGTARVH